MPLSLAEPFSDGAVSAYPVGRGLCAADRLGLAGGAGQAEIRRDPLGWRISAGPRKALYWELSIRRRSAGRNTGLCVRRAHRVGEHGGTAAPIARGGR